jgi:hypothetical protein
VQCLWKTGIAKAFKKISDLAQDFEACAGLVSAAESKKPALPGCGIKATLRFFRVFSPSLKKHFPTKKPPGGTAFQVLFLAAAGDQPRDPLAIGS